MATRPLCGPRPLHRGCGALLHLRGFHLRLAQSRHRPGALRPRPLAVYLEEQRRVRRYPSKYYRNQCFLYTY